MKTAPKMTEALAAICRKYGGDPNHPNGWRLALDAQPWGGFFINYVSVAMGANILGTVDCGFTLPRPEYSDPFADPCFTFFRTPEGLAPYIFNGPLGRVIVSGHDGTHTLYRALDHDQYETFLDYAEAKADQLQRIFLGKDATTVAVLESRPGHGSFADALRDLLG